ncbi:MAG: bifunctional hydroxymethylpyrimidine kinase/phosphomethylpyrimidine kinase [Chloroflexota bacterium]
MSFRQPLAEPIKVLTIAGADSGGSVGLQADLLTFGALGAFGLSALTVATAQNSVGITAVHFIPPDFLAQQLDAVLSDYGQQGGGIQGIKTGFLAQVPLIEVVVDKLRPCMSSALVVDPVLVNGRGEAMFPEAVVDAYRTQLLPLATVVTPNRHELRLLADVDVPQTLAEFETAVSRIHQLGPKYVLAKGFHDGDQLVDVLYDGRKFTHFVASKVETNNIKGSGDTLSAALCVFLARGDKVETAVRQAHQFTNHALKAAAGWQLGQGAGPLGQWRVEIGD